MGVILSIFSSKTKNNIKENSIESFLEGTKCNFNIVNKFPLNIELNQNVVLKNFKEVFGENINDFLNDRFIDIDLFIPTKKGKIKIIDDNIIFYFYNHKENINEYDYISNPYQIINIFYKINLKSIINRRIYSFIRIDGIKYSTIYDIVNDNSEDRLNEIFYKMNIHNMNRKRYDCYYLDFNELDN